LGLLGALAIVAGLTAGRLVPQGATDLVTRAYWADIYETAPQMVADVDAIVRVRHLDSLPGRTAGADGEGAPMQFVNNYFTVVQTFKGDLVAGGGLIVEQSAEMLDDGTLTGIDSDGGPYTSGREYLLFLKAQPEAGYYYVVSYQGRYNIVGKNLFGVHGHDPVVLSLANRTVGEAIDQVTAALASSATGAAELTTQPGN
jgi:hypothetical protein